MEIIALGSAKGGVGKSATVKSLAAAYEANGKKVLIIDADTNANSATWLDFRKQNMPDTTIDGVRVKSSNAVVTQDIEGYDIVLIDTSGVASSLTAKLAQFCDLFLVPTFNDTDSLNEALDTCEILGSLRAAHGILRIYDMREKEDNRDADEFLESENAPVLDTVLRKTSAFKKLNKQGLAPTDIKTKRFFGRNEGDDARSDLANLIKEIEG